MPACSSWVVSGYTSATLNVSAVIPVSPEPPPPPAAAAVAKTVVESAIVRNAPAHRRMVRVMSPPCRRDGYAGA